ncbi:thiamine pyrophosphate-binding protein [Caldovatus aquaticus]|uniref:Thiamine pyrophosphate-binding protein n=1 Tax=Caldovatus aquaticus TaxID=2865671 RepID=A0ABS7EZ40_9PROT|nr:thiamine pyrophosphate-binding protein [Caldovatus aquaticus]
MSSSNYTVADLVAEFLHACGVTTAFGIVSVHNIPMLDAIGRRNAIRFVAPRGEMGGGHMADAYARVSGGLGVLITSTGPGAANAVPALVEARFAGSPLLHITGQTPTRFLDRDTGSVHDVPGQTAMLASVCKAAYRVRAAGEAFGILTRAAAEALTSPAGPVSVEIPIDLQRAPIGRPAGLDRLKLPIPAPLAPDEAALDEAAAIFAKAKRPMVWLGNGARHARAQAMMLLELGFGAVNSWNGRGIVPEDHPMTFGGLNGNGAPRIQEFYQTVDAMLVVGSRLRAHETAELSVKLPRTLVHADIDPRANGRTYPSALFVHGDAALVMEGLARRLMGRLAPDPAFAAEFRETKRRAVAEYCAGLGPYADFPWQLRRAMPRDAVFVRDVTISHTTWGNRIFPVLGPRDSVHPVGAAIGPGLPFGIGAALAAAPEGRKTVVMTGDGGFAVNLAELWTAAQERAELVIIVMNDRGYGIIKVIQNAMADGRHFAADPELPRLEPLAALAGMPFFRVAEAAAFGATVAQALAVRGPALVEVDMQAIGEIPPYPPYSTMGLYARAARGG